MVNKNVMQLYEKMHSQIETKFRAVCPDKKKVVLHLENRSIVVCERR